MGEHKDISGRELINPNFQKSQEMPDISDLSERIKFSPDKGHIWLDKRRMFLLHSRAFGSLRQNMIENFGIDSSKAVLMRTGYTAGSLDAEMASRVRNKDDLFDAFSVGPQMHALLGVTLAECTEFEVNVSKGQFYAEYIWHDSIEDDAHLRFFDIGPDPVCWFQIGYASGYSSVFIGQQIIFKEVECRSQGYKECRIVGKTAEEWENIDDELSILQPQLIKLSGETGDVPNVPISQINLKSNAKPSRTQQPVMPLDNVKGHPEFDEGFVGVSPGFQNAFSKIKKVANTDATVLFLGESGVGKEIFAQKLHKLSNRSPHPFIAVNCAAIPESLIESELFGVEKGAYTGAVSSRKGRFERADGGTLFLDEIGSISLSAQGKLLRALQEGEIERLGGAATHKVNTRVIAATNVDLMEEIKEGRFREDLYYRLNVFPVHIPPLRDRKADIPLLIDYFFKRFSEHHQMSPSGFTERAIHALFTYAWPGNIREMENMIERAVILSDPEHPVDIPHLFTSGEKITSHLMTVSMDGHLNTLNPQVEMETGQNSTALQPHVANEKMNSSLKTILDSDASFRDIETQLLELAVDEAGGNLSKASRKLGMTRAQLAYKLKKGNPRKPSA